MTTIRAIRADTYDGGRWLRLPALREYEYGYRKWMPCPDDEWDDVKPEFRRTVSPVLPADLTELWVGVEQEHCPLTSVWAVNPCTCDDKPTRLALVYRCSGVTELPVVDLGQLLSGFVRPGTDALTVGGGQVTRYEPGSGRPRVLVDGAPADLAPGDVVLDLGTVEAIDPITEMVCPELHEPEWEEPNPEDWPSCGEFVPLVLPSDRVTEIEVP